ncbi:MAG: glycosyltransferase [Burkholderiales bacterium]|nr:glycosyltransferase [Burkholderiales bacterium]
MNALNPDPGAEGIAAIVTTYRPDAGLCARLAPLLEACTTVIVVDNTPGGSEELGLPAAFRVIRNMSNVGLGAALNIGLREALSMQAGIVVLLDQDSTPSADFVRRMAVALRQAIAEHGPRACIGPQHVDNASGAVQGGLRAPRAPRDERRVAVSCLATSGMTLDARCLGPRELFGEDLFLDLVDFEWCWRLSAGGWTFLRDASISMPHRLGIAERRWCGLRIYAPAPYRHYYQVRDTLRLLSRAYVPIAAKFKLAGRLLIQALIYPLALDRGGERLSWMTRGVVDAVRKVEGIGAAATRLA